MKKVGIMTWFSYNNYGSVLQAYALGETIKKFGFNVEYINYIPKDVPKIMFDLSPKEAFSLLAEKMKFLKTNEAKKMINIKYDDFRKNFKLSDKCEGYTDLETVSKKYDYIVCGSDQIWSPNAYDENYFLTFAENVNKIAYAPSFGVSKINSEFVNSRIISMVNEFDNVSVREENGKSILKNNNIFKALDPTFLLNEKEWIDALNLSKIQKEKYILCYFLGKNSKYYNFAKEIAKKYNYKLLIIPTNEMSLKDKDNVIIDCGPIEFLEYIRNAELVLTDSYHGMLFSINFNKKFIIFERFNNNKKSQNSRIYNTLKVFSLEDRLYNNISKNLTHLFETDYSKVNEKLLELKNESLNYLSNALKTDNKKTDDEKKITKLCTGCGMCAAVCPKGCIKIIKNDFGFYEYTIESEKCINCGLCKKVCGQVDNKTVSLNNKKLFACKSLNDELVQKSSSGGLAFEMGKNALTNQMNVIGCTYDYDNNIAKHIVVDTIDKMPLLSGSKYLQSYTVDAFSRIKNMQQGIIFGTPCQISSINNYLNYINKRDNFILIDIICHGVPSYNIWTRLINNKKIISVNFRNKKDGWHKKVLTINNVKVKNKEFYDFFDSNLAYDRCCYDCNYRNKSSADIRIGDFWGEKYNKNNKGMNMAIIITERGEEFFNRLNEKEVFKKIEEIEDYKINQQFANIPMFAYYYDLMNELSNNKIPTNKICTRYCKKIVLDKGIRNLFRFLKR